uniref:NADH-ubiquinone oxidoreductase chain 4L n=1 Tax=Proasellus hercegovinensis TaxID=1281977 RepID=A0A485M8W5_9CRUS|nr:NADH dehydrogenase subunit 4l [Proasellus hercegovinensis]
MFSIGALSFMLNKKHLLAALISLEYMVLSLFMLVSLFYPLSWMVNISLAFLTISVCEGALGLSVLVLYTRSFGGESLETTALNMW